MKSVSTIILIWATLCSCPAFSQTYSTDFDGTENPLSEGGAWSHAGADWQKVQKVNGIAYGTQTGSGGYDDSYAHLSGFPPDQSAFGVIQRTSGSSGIHEVEIHLRWSDSAHSAKGYECLISYDGSYAQIVRWNGPFGDFTYIGWAAKAPVPKTGDTLKATIVGSLITVFYNGAELMRATDSTHKTGNPGMGFYRETSGANSDMAFSSFTATAVGTSIVKPLQGRVSGCLPLVRNFPDPFRTRTTIMYTVRSCSFVTLKIYDFLGRERVTLVNGKSDAGRYSKVFDGSGLAGGVYRYVLTEGKKRETGRMVFLR
jgi:hypothetical protein